MTEPILYSGREQTLVKHFLFEKYLERLAHIVGSRWESITYIDGFSGPWNARSQDYKDSSFSIALEELKKARETHKNRNKQLRIRCFFIEKKPSAYALLKSFTEKSRDRDTDIETFNGNFEESIEKIVKFIRDGGINTFIFVFIDPKGWNGYAMDKIKPLFQFPKVEVLINFQIDFIRRFIEQEETQENFHALYGKEDIQSKIAGQHGQHREDIAVSEYCQALRESGDFKYVVPAIVLNPQREKPHFRLIYGTRNLKGVEVFKTAEKRAMEMMESTRADVRKKKREQKFGQRELFDGQQLHDSRYFDMLRSRYSNRAKERVLKLLRTRSAISFDDIWVEAMQEPLTWENDLKKWIKEWHSEGKLEVMGLTTKEIVPKLQKGHVLVWK